MAALANKKIGFVGGGAMAEALVSGFLSTGLLQAGQIAVHDIAKERIEHLTDTYHVSFVADSCDLAGEVDVLFLTVKPQVIPKVLVGLSHAVRSAATIISVAAGVSLRTLEAKLPALPIVRVMPNTPVAVGEGMSAIALGTHATQATGELALQLFSAVGKAVLVQEYAMDAVTGLSGSGPGYVFVLIDALADAGVRAGLARPIALTLAAQTVLGSAKMVLETREHPAKLRDMVTSPGGTTIAGIHVMEQQGVRAAFIDAVLAATQRSREMGQANG